MMVPRKDLLAICCLSLIWPLFGYFSMLANSKRLRRRVRIIKLNLFLRIISLTVHCDTSDDLLPINDHSDSDGDLYWGCHFSSPTFIPNAI